MMKRRNRSRSQRRRTFGIPDAQGALLIAVSGFVACCLTLGGGVFRPSVGIVMTGVMGAMLLAVVLTCATRPRDLPTSAVVLLSALILLPAVQLIPLPFGWWSALPGRALPAAIATLVSGSAPWRPLTLSVTGTLGALLCLTWLVALVVAVLAMTEANVRRVIVLILIIGVVDVSIGALQFVSHGTLFNFYNNSSRELLLGFFANKNHSGLFLACLPLIGFALISRGRSMRRETLVWMVPAALVVMVAIIATYSRAGLVLGLIALAMVAGLSRAGSKQGHPALLLGMVLAGLVIAGLLSTPLGDRAVARFGLVENDLRWLFWRGSWPLAKAYFPFGAGFGTFEHLFATNEHLEWVKPTYVNNAHNDYLEAVIEAGVPAAILIILAFATVGRALVVAWGIRHELAGRWALAGGGIIMLFTIHSLGDYPLRRMGTAALFFFALGLVLRVFGAGGGTALRVRQRQQPAGLNRADAFQE